MASVTEILKFADELLDVSGWTDYGPIGLQVAAAPAEVTRIATGVSSSLALFRQAQHLGAQLVLTHHGLLWNNMPQVIDGTFRHRLKALLDHDIALAAYHLPLDAHPVIGNNALIAAELGADVDRSVQFAQHDGRAIGV